MSGQNFKNHARFDPAFHFVLFPVLLLSVVGAGVNLKKTLDTHQGLYSASLLFVALLSMLVLQLITRVYALKAQDRAIRAEENLRHFVLTGKLLDPRLSVKQIVALRFAPDAEFADLAKKAAESQMDPKLIKESIRNWRGDYYRI
ncbi:MAG: hypothetical protein HY820_34425 [Acidobacteria bacterium]|nr:hypothetical protein [Acidobacteriota bacterium]